MKALIILLVSISVLALVLTQYHASTPAKLTLRQNVALVEPVETVQPSKPKDEFPEEKLQFVDYVKHFNYPVEVHYITTDDGYILQFFRIQAKNTQIQSGLPVIYFQHGLIDSSDSSIMNYEEKAIAFTLANEKYDVWLGNSRGNFHSRNHTTLDPKQKEFWQWSFQDMAKYDLPKAFEYISTLTGQKINYIGHSQGTTQMFAALAEHNPIVEANIRKFIALGPVAYVRNITSALFSLLAKQSWLFELFDLTNMNEQLARDNSISVYGTALCNIIPAICDNLLKYVMDADPKFDDWTRLDVYLYHEPSGASTQDFHHWAQMVTTGEFKKFDYGSPAKNKKHYGQPTPPKWNISDINIPVHLFVGSDDELADPNDAKYTQSLLQKSTFNLYEGMGHATFLIGKDMSYLQDVLKTIRED